MSLLGNDTAGKQTRLLQCKRVKWITRPLQLFYVVKLTMSVHVTAVKNYLALPYFLHGNFNRLLAIEQNRHVQYRPAVFIAVWRSIAPAAAPVHTKRQLYSVLVLNYSCILVISQLLDSGIKHLWLDSSEALLYLVFVLQYHAKIIMKTKLFRKISPAKALFQPVPLYFGKWFSFGQLLSRYLIAYRFGDLVHCHQISHSLVPRNYGIWVSRIKSRT